MEEALVPPSSTNTNKPGGAISIARNVLTAVALIAVGIAIGARGVAPSPSGESKPARLKGSNPEHKLIGHDKNCQSLNFTDETLHLIHEVPIISYFRLAADRELATGDVLKSFEASDVTSRVQRRANGGESFETFVVFDNAKSIARFSSLLESDAYSQQNRPPRLLDYPNDDGLESEFEGIAYNSAKDVFYVIRESVTHADGSNIAHVYELKLPSADDASAEEFELIGGPCNTEQQFETANKGFEGADWLPLPGANAQGGYLVAICEGNNCMGGKAGRQPGNGRVVLMEKSTDGHAVSTAAAAAAAVIRAGGSASAAAAAAAGAATAATPQPGHRGCLWKTVAVLPLPPSLLFMDYSAIALRPIRNEADSWAVAVASQENAAVWIGRLNLNLAHNESKPEAEAEAPTSAVSQSRAPRSGKPARLRIDPSRFAFNRGRIYDFPRDGECRRIYCNIEGISWQGDDKLVAASDQMKNAGRQDFRCWDKDQSLHTFLVAPLDDMYGDRE